MNRVKTYTSKSEQRKFRVRSNLFGTSLRPRISVHKTNQAFYAQVINDQDQLTILGGNTLKDKGLPMSEQASILAAQIAKKMTDKNLTAGIFDKGQYKYHGAVKKFVDVLRDNKINI